MISMTCTVPPNFAAQILKREREASVDALTQGAFHLRETMKHEIKDSIHNPIKRTENAQLFKVNKEKLQVDFFLNDNADKGGVSPAKYLSPLIHGTSRRNKAMEHYFGKRFFVPNPQTKLDAFGNIPRGQVTRMLSDLKAFGEVGFNMNAVGGKRGKAKQKKKDGYFVIPSARNPNISVVMYRRGSESTPFGMATPTRPKYEKALDWYYVVESKWPVYIREEFDKAWAKKFGG